MRSPSPRSAAVLRSTVPVLAILAVLVTPRPAASLQAAAVPDVGSLVAQETSSLRDLVDRYAADRAALGRRWTVPYSDARRERFREFYAGWSSSTDALVYEGLGVEGQIDYQLMKNELRYRLTLLDREEKLQREMEDFLPFTSTIVELEERRRAREPVESEAARSGSPTCRH